MTVQATAKNWAIDRAPARIELLGDKQRRPEPAEHIIEFPGGAIEVSRTSDGNYWAHIIINQRAAFTDGSTRETARGEIIGSRIQNADGLANVPGDSSLTQIAVLVRPVFR